MRKIAESPLSAGALPLPPSPVPEVQVVSQFAPGRRGPLGTAPRTNYSKVNTGAIPAPDAGATEQKSLQPKYGSAMNKIAGRTTLQELVNASYAGVISRTKLAAEAKRQQESQDSEDKCCEKCGKEKCSCGGKMASATAVSTLYAEKLANALDFLSNSFAKEAATQAPPAHITENVVGPGTGPGALEVTHATASTSLPDHKGEATPKNVVPMHPAQEKGKPQDHGATAMATNDHQAPGGNARTPQKVAGVLSNYLVGGLPGVYLGDLAHDAGESEIASAAHPTLTGLAGAGLGGAAGAGLAAALGRRPAGAALIGAGLGGMGGVGYGTISESGRLRDLIRAKQQADADTDKTASLHYKNLRRLGIKVAEDAINPAQISAGPAVPPQASASGEPGGEPAGGAPQGPTSALASNEAAINLKRREAYANRKADMKKWLTEPMDSAAHDNTLQAAFSNTNEAGPKVASVKTAAARALIAKLAEGMQ